MLDVRVRCVIHVEPGKHTPLCSIIINIILIAVHLSLGFGSVHGFDLYHFNPTSSTIKYVLPLFSHFLKLFASLVNKRLSGAKRSRLSHQSSFRGRRGMDGAV